MGKQKEYGKLNTLLQELAAEEDRFSSLEIAICAANEVMRIVFPDNERGEAWASTLLEGDDLLDRVVLTSSFSNQKVETWFETHPNYPSQRTALKHFCDDSAPIESRFYWLNKSATKPRIAAGAALTQNWEDGPLTKGANYKVGVDFFLTADANALLVVLSDAGNLRVLELSERLSNTQIEILNKIDGAVGLTTADDEPPQGIVHQTLWDAFALKEVNKHFYEGIAEHFQSLLAYMQEHSDKSEEDIKLFANRLIGRLLFIWFLRKKKFINEEIGYFDCEDAPATDYYEKKLKPLFFNTLNKPQAERDEVDGVRDEYTPFLNGGLFEPSETDWEEERIDFPPDWFQSLYSHFDQFNFTTDESTPEYEQVAIDPEMLGRVFENLLASQLDETGQEARKASGSFYTPREIVSYMCKEALRQYLYGKLDDESLHEGVDVLLDKSDQDFEKDHSNSKRGLWGLERRDEVVEKVLTALNKIQILDPACGSGAFPMGMLQLLIKTYTRLGYKPKSYDLKLQILENNIYGVDIQPMAAEIARLRAWLSIIVDEEDAGNVRPLPNLEFKFVCANTLVPLEKDEVEQGVFWDVENAEAEEKLDGLRHIYFQVTEPQDKKQTRVEYHRIIENSSGADSKRMRQIKEWDPFTLMKPAPFFDSDKMFGVRDGFDVLIGNPPYIQIQTMSKDMKSKYKKVGYQTYESTGDIYALFYERGFEFLHKGGVLCYITSNKWMRTVYGQSLRNFFLNKINPIRLIDLARTRVFESATVDVNIFVGTKEQNHGEFDVTVLREDFQSNLSDYVKQNSRLYTFNLDENWAILSDTEKNIKEKIEAIGIPLQEWDIKINRGILTGCNKAFFIDSDVKDRLIAEDSRSAEIIRPILRGKDIKRYGHNFKNLWLIVTHNGYSEEGETVPPINIDDYPAIKRHLDTYWDEIKERGDQGCTPYNLRNCAYIGDFSKLKIMYPNMTKFFPFYLDDEGFFQNDKSFFITGESLAYLVSFFNSKLFEYAYIPYFPELAGQTRELRKVFFDMLKVKPVSAEQNEYFLGLVNDVQEKKKLCQDASDIEAEIDEAIFDLYEITSAERDCILKHTRF